MNLAVVLEGLLMTTGRTRTVLVVGVIGSWCGQVPIVALLVSFWQRSLCAVYLGVSAGYLLLCALLSLSLLRLDWDLLAREAEARAGVPAPPPAAQSDGGHEDGAAKPAAAEEQGASSS